MFERREHDLTGRTFRNTVVRGGDLRGGGVTGLRLRGVDVWDVEVHGELRNVVVNGVDIGPLVEAELDRRDPERALMRPETGEGFRAAWEVLEGRWAATVARARGYDEARLHEPVGDEWSFVSTLRHLCFATDAWVARMVLGDPSPWHPLDLPWDEAPGWEGVPWDREARPSLDEVLAVRAERQALVRGVLDGLGEEQLAGTVSMPPPGWPAYDDVPVRECLLVVLNEEWEHRAYAERDLDVLDARDRDDESD
ncbi:DinB family protein [Nocardioides anomalus]|uniref:DinB family protein n=1 Tax=Nocardioides anomalus TaxID=2712223 RepID=A0A6G6WFA0_9ACTN|nr:DinB family protein [Nocardioides anomalus]QIG43720.1 DinB family protein [Nocardioides anomalus]